MAKVCIDAGHFTGYNRSPAVPAYYEGNRMWVLSEYLIAALKDKGIEVVRTRKDVDTDLALVKRGRAAKGCDLFLSLHSNAVGSYVNENVDYPVAYVMRENAATDRDEKSGAIGLLLAQTVQHVMGTQQSARTSTRENTSDRDGNGLRDDEYYGVLQGAKEVDVPGVILEHSFHTNTKMANWLMVDSNLNKLAEAEADCIADWLGIEEDDDMMTQEQFNAMMDNYLAELAKKEPSEWSKDAREWAEDHGYINGDSAGNKQYKKFATREELAQLLYNMREG